MSSEELESHHITHHDHEVVEFFFIVPWTGGTKKFMEFHGTYGIPQFHCAPTRYSPALLECLGEQKLSDTEKESLCLGSEVAQDLKSDVGSKSSKVKTERIFKSEGGNKSASHPK